MFLTFQALGTLNFTEIAERAPQAFQVGGATITAITLSSPSCCFCGSSCPIRSSAMPTPAQSAAAIATPIHICRVASLRPSLARKAAMMPTIRAASTPSRRVMTNVGIISC